MNSTRTFLLVPSKRTYQFTRSQQLIAAGIATPEHSPCIGRFDRQRLYGLGRLRCA